MTPFSAAALNPTARPGQTIAALSTTYLIDCLKSLTRSVPTSSATTRWATFAAPAIWAAGATMPATGFLHESTLVLPTPTPEMNAATGLPTESAPTPGAGPASWLPLAAADNTPMTP